MYEEITTERLDNFGAVLREYDTLLRHKNNIIQRIGVLRGVDYSKTRVMSGNAPKPSEQEYYAQSLEKINSKLKEYEAWIKPEKEIIKTQIARVKKRDYRRLLVFRYIERWKWSEIVQEFFEFEADYDDDTKDGKYRDTLMYWNRRALEELEKVSSKPYIQSSRQLVFGE